MTQQVDFLWLRLLDVPAALSAQLCGAGEVVLEVPTPRPAAAVLPPGATAYPPTA